MVMPISAQLTLPLSHPIHHRVGRIIYRMMECCRSRGEGLILPPPPHLITVTALQLHSPRVSHGWSRRQRAPPFFFFFFYALSRLVHAVDRKGQRYIEEFVTPFFSFFRRIQKRQKVGSAGTTKKNLAHDVNACFDLQGVQLKGL